MKKIGTIQVHFKVTGLLAGDPAIETASMNNNPLETNSITLS